MPKTSEPSPLRRRDLRTYRVGALRQRNRRRVGTVVASFVGFALLVAVAPPVLNGDSPADAVASLPARLAGLGELASRGADQAVRGADGVVGAMVASRSEDRHDAIQQVPSPSAMASAVGEQAVADRLAPQLGALGSTPGTAPTPSAASAAAASRAAAAAAPAPVASAPAAAPTTPTALPPATVAPPLSTVAPPTAAVAPPVSAVGPPATPAAPSLTTDEQFAARLVELTNVERSTAGLPALATSSCATAQAAARAAVLVAQGRFQHDPLGPILAACGGGSVGENLALGYRTPEAMTAGWMASPGHRENILRGYTSIGIGCVTGSSGVLCSQVFLG
ncbi:MAG: CAP domain-containing protein [Cellulomonas sp.]